jgi:hypothetical protein
VTTAEDDRRYRKELFRREDREAPHVCVAAALLAVKSPTEGEYDEELLWDVVRPEGLEPPAYWFEASRSIQLSYGRARSQCSIRALPVEAHLARLA